MFNEPPTAPLDQALLQRARALKQTQLFVGTSDMARLLDKQKIFLVLAGLKPVAAVLSGHWVSDPEGRHTVPDDPKQVSDFLASLGLVSEVEQRDAVTIAMVSLRQELLDEYARASDADGDESHVLVGRLYGYPETAVAGFARGESMPMEEQERIEQEAGLADGICPFRFSRDHWKAELQLVQHWQHVLGEYSLLED